MAAAGLSQAQFTFVDVNVDNAVLAGEALILEVPVNYLFDESGGTDGFWSYHLADGFEGGRFDDKLRPRI